MAANLSAASKEASMTGLSKNKVPVAVTVTTATTRKILTQARSKIQLKNGGKDGLRLSNLRVAPNHRKPKAKNLPARTNVANVGMLGIMPQLARNSRKYQWREIWHRREMRNGREICNYNYH